jgi:hypothetical protein
MSAPDLRGWAPIRIYWQDGVPRVDWCELVEARFDEPFFDQTIERCLLRPFALLFRHQTPLDALDELAAQPVAAPAGFVFHMSRCGSTLLAQMLAALPAHLVISEAGPIDMLLRAHLRDPRITDAQRVAWLRGLLAAYAQCGQRARRLFVKFDSWSVFALPLIRRAFPDTPWIFLYREPLEVLVSHARERGSQMLPGVLQPELLGLDWQGVGRLSLDEYSARVLERICAAAVAHAELGGGRLLHYRQLPGALWETLGGHFGLCWTAAELAQMAAVAGFHAKRPHERFAPDAEEKRRAATPELRALAAQRLDPWYAQLEALRLRDEAAPAQGGGR